MRFGSPEDLFRLTQIDMLARQFAHPGWGQQLEDDDLKDEIERTRGVVESAMRELGCCLMELARRTDAGKAFKLEMEARRLYDDFQAEILTALGLKLSTAENITELQEKIKLRDPSALLVERLLNTFLNMEHEEAKTKFSVERIGELQAEGKTVDEIILALLGPDEEETAVTVPVEVRRTKDLDVIEHLKDYYPGEDFHSHVGIKDDLGYTHWVMVSNQKRVVVVTTDEHDTVCEQVEVPIETAPTVEQLRDGKRPWRAGGSLQGLVFEATPANPVYPRTWSILPEFLHLKHPFSPPDFLLGNHELDALLALFGFVSASESLYEFGNEFKSDEEVTALLVSLGAKPADLGVAFHGDEPEASDEEKEEEDKKELYDNVDVPNGDLTDQWVADLVRHGSEWEDLGLNDDHINEESAKGLGRALAAKFIFGIFRDLGDDGDNRYDVRLTPLAYWNKYKLWFDQHAPLEPLLPPGANQVMESTFTFDENGFPKYTDPNVLMKEMLACGFTWTEEFQKGCDDQQVADARLAVLPMLNRNV